MAVFESKESKDKTGNIVITFTADGIGTHTTSASIPKITVTPHTATSTTSTWDPSLWKTTFGPVKTPGPFTTPPRKIEELQLDAIQELQKRGIKYLFVFPGDPDYPEEDGDKGPLLKTKNFGALINTEEEMETFLICAEAADQVHLHSDAIPRIYQCVRKGTPPRTTREDLKKAYAIALEETSRIFGT